MNNNKEDGAARVARSAGGPRSPRSGHALGAPQGLASQRKTTRMGFTTGLGTPVRPPDYARLETVPPTGEIRAI